jgi:predicted dinucleotide-binding enzyme
MLRSTADAKQTRDHGFMHLSAVKAADTVALTVPASSCASAAAAAAAVTSLSKLIACMLCGLAYGIHMIN